MTFEQKRTYMIDTQLIRRGINDINVLDAMRRALRHKFVSNDQIDKAYNDNALSIGEGQTISQPYMVAVMTELLEISRDMKVLEIGTGSGYQAAVLSEIAKAVYTVERIESIANSAIERFKQLGYKNIFVKVSDGTEGWQENAKFDRIIITASAPEIPSVLKDQLSDTGIILAPVGTKSLQKLLKLKKDGNRITEEYSVPCVFVPLIGKYGWDK